jgi:hypothetical protein
MPHRPTSLSRPRSARVLPAGATIVAAFAAAPSSRAAEWAKPSEWGAKQICAKRKCRTIASDRKVRVFRATDRHGYDLVFGEWRPTRQIKETSAEEGSLVASVLRGTVFAYATRPEKGGFEMVRVENLHPGHEGDIGGGWPAAENLSGRGVIGLSVAASGKVAWLLEGRFWNQAEREMSPSSTSRAIFCAAPRADEPALVAYGPDLAPSALKADAERCLPVRNPKYHD